LWSLCVPFAVPAFQLCMPCQAAQCDPRCGASIPVPKWAPGAMAAPVTAHRPVLNVSTQSMPGNLPSPTLLQCNPPLNNPPPHHMPTCICNCFDLRHAQLSMATIRLPATITPLTPWRFLRPAIHSYVFPGPFPLPSPPATTTTAQVMHYDLRCGTGTPDALGRSRGSRGINQGAGGSSAACRRLLACRGYKKDRGQTREVGIQQVVLHNTMHHQFNAHRVSASALQTESCVSIVSSASTTTRCSDLMLCWLPQCVCKTGHVPL
jgi:hypothetical protein